MYPLHLVTDTQKIYQSAFRLFARQFNARALKLLEKSSRADILAGLVWLEASVEVPGASVRFDADLFTWLEELRQKHGDDIPKEKFQKQLTMNAQQVNAFSRARFISAIESGRNSLRRPDAARPQIPTVDFTRGDNLAKEKVDGFVKENVGLINDLSRSHATSIVDAIRDGVIHGKSLKEIAAQITEETRKSENQAAFWAEDQVGSLFGDITQERQTAAGSTWYTWRTMKDQRVRDLHDDLEDTVHRWDAPPLSGTGDRMFAHPGKGYRCRCFAEMGFGPMPTDRQLDPDRLKREMERKRIGK